MPTASSSSRSRAVRACAWSVTCAPGRRLAPGAARPRRSSPTGRSPRSPGSSAARTWRCTRSMPTSCAAWMPPPGARSSSGCWAGRRPPSCAPRRSPPRSSRATRMRCGGATAAASRARASSPRASRRSARHGARHSPRRTRTTRRPPSSRACAPTWREPVSARRSSRAAATCTTATPPRCGPGRRSSACAARPRSSCRSRWRRASVRSPASGSRGCAARPTSARRELADLRTELDAAQVASQLEERDRVLIEHAATIREAALGRARDEGERDQLGVERARAESQAARSDDLAQRVLGRPLRDADRAGARDRPDRRSAGGGRALRERDARRHRSRDARAGLGDRRAVALFGVLAALAIAFPGPRPVLAVAAAIAAGLAAFLVSKRRAARAMRGALAVHSAGVSALVTALGELHVAESRIAHPDQSLVGDIEQLRIVTREHALSTRRLAQLEEGELRAAERGATLAAILGTDDPERLSSELEAAQRRDAQATAARERLAELEPRVAAASDRARLGSERLSELESPGPQRLAHGRGGRRTRAPACSEHAPRRRRSAGAQPGRGRSRAGCAARDRARPRSSRRAPGALGRRARNAGGRAARGACPRRGRSCCASRS